MLEEGNCSDICCNASLSHALILRLSRHSAAILAPSLNFNLLLSAVTLYSKVLYSIGLQGWNLDCTHLILSSLSPTMSRYNLLSPYPLLSYPILPYSI